MGIILFFFSISTSQGVFHDIQKGRDSWYKGTDLYVHPKGAIAERGDYSSWELGKITYVFTGTVKQGEKPKKRGFFAGLCGSGNDKATHYEVKYYKNNVKHKKIFKCNSRRIQPAVYNKTGNDFFCERFNAGKNYHYGALL